MGEHPNEKNTGISLKRPKKAKKGQQIKHSTIFLSLI